MIADELSQDDIDSLLGGLGGDDKAGGGSADALGALAGDSAGASPSSTAAAAAHAATPTVSLPEFQPEAPKGDVVEEVTSLLSNVGIKIKVRLGKSEMLVEDILKLQPGRVVQLDSMSGDPVDLLVNGKVVAKGEVIILNEAFCVRISEIYDTRNKLERQQ